MARASDRPRATSRAETRRPPWPKLALQTCGSVHPRATACRNEGAGEPEAGTAGGRDRGFP
eukprot:1893368-Lingulodinium_polyedra.AAC.1